MNTKSVEKPLMDRIAHLEKRCVDMQTVMIAAAEEIERRRDLYLECDGVRLVNLLRHLQSGLEVSYPAYSPGKFQQLVHLVDSLGYENRRLSGMVGHYRFLRDMPKDSRWRYILDLPSDQWDNAISNAMRWDAPEPDEDQ